MFVPAPNQDLSTPYAFLDEAALRSNINWMQILAGRFGFELSPHGKTTLSPEIFKLQLAAGAWGITVADAAQAQVALDAGAKRILVANQIVDAKGIVDLAEIVSSGKAEIYVCADSVDALDRLVPVVRRHPSHLYVLIEIGVAGGRCGCRSAKQAIDLVRYARHNDISVAGLEGYEGSIEADAEDMPQAIAAFLDIFRQVWPHLDVGRGKILSVSGSSYYDIIIDENARNAIAPGGTLVFRPGCYVTHDAGFYADLFAAMVRRHPEIIAEAGLKNALFVVGTVLSCPEEGLAVANFGRRHIGFDQGNPKIAYRVGSKGTAEPVAGIVVRELNDQHCIMTGATQQLKTGDTIIALQSHPCTTFDKWRTVHLVDTDGAVVGQVHPLF